MLNRKNATYVTSLAVLIALVATLAPLRAAEATTGRANQHPGAQSARRVARTSSIATTVQEAFNDIQGATYDQNTGELILIGANNAALPPIDKDALTVALRTRYDFFADPQDYWPGVTIEFSPTNSSVMDVTYFGRVRDTRFGYVLFESDRLLKYYGLGYDNSTGTPVPISSSVPGYESELACLSRLGYVPPQNQTIQWRKWFSPTLTIATTPDSTAIAFTQANLKLNWQYDTATQSAKVSQCVQAFVDHFNAHYQDFANEQQALGNPVLHELLQLAKITAVAEWLQSREIDGRIPGLNAIWLNSIPTTPHTTPATTPLINVTQGSLIQSGGVDFSISPSSFVPDDGRAQGKATLALTSRPGRAAIWSAEGSCPLCCGASGLSLNDPQPEVLGDVCVFQAVSFANNRIDVSKAQTTGNIIVLNDGFAFRNDGKVILRGNLRDKPLRVTMTFEAGHNSPQAKRSASGLQQWRQIFQGSPNQVFSAAAQAPARDFLYVRLIPEHGAPILLQTITDADPAGVWTPSPGFDLTAYTGQQIQIEFEAQIAEPVQTIFFVRKIQLNTPFYRVYLPLIVR